MTGTHPAPTDVETDWRDWSELAARESLRVPRADDDKYSRGVLGVVTGSKEYPGAAVLGVEAAVRTGLGMVRYLGPGRAAQMVLLARPEVVTAPGRVQAWLLGSGMDPSTRTERAAERLEHALADGTPLVVDAGALDLVGRIEGPAVLTPHAGELATLLTAAGTEVTRGAISADPAHWAGVAADLTGHVVLLKGRVTHVCAPAAEGRRRGARIKAPSSWAATAGSGDVLGGI
ncbi:MAG: ADP/ATP-dependent (S)-NAD(P)H-hydrate dehydratase, partial [Herbiconiux sp.]|nr:ADP/ATP-dependent (S)-NAD(P)H-hydrate dehydratase [Herbiconiux sp.]